MKINKKVSDFSETFEWTSLGLNQGPPDYESVKVGFFKISQNIFVFPIWLFIRYLLTLQPK